MGRIHYKPVARASDFPWTTMAAQQGADVVCPRSQKPWLGRREGGATNLHANKPALACSQPDNSPGVPPPPVNPTTSHKMLRMLLCIQGQSSGLSSRPRMKPAGARLAARQNEWYLLGNAAKKFTFLCYQTGRRLTLGTGAVLMSIAGAGQQLNWLCQLLSISSKHVWSFIKPPIVQCIEWDGGQVLPPNSSSCLPHWAADWFPTGSSGFVCAR